MSAGLQAGGRPENASVDVTGAADTQTLHSYFSSLRRRRVVPACMLLGLLLGALYVAATPVTYRSQASVLVSPIPASPEDVTRDTYVEPSLDTEASIIGSAAVARRVAARIDESDVGAVAARLLVTAPPNTRVLRIQFRDRRAAIARAGAQAAAEAYLQVRATLVARHRQDHLDALGGRRSELRQRQTAVTRQLTSSADRRVTNALLARRHSIATQIGELDVTIAQLESTEADAGRLVLGASSPTGRRLAARTAAPTSGLMLGLLLGVVLARSRDTRARLLTDRRDIEHVAGLPVLAEFRVSRHGSRAHRARNLENYRLLRRELSTPELRRCKVVGVTAPRGTATPTSIAVGFAVGMARFGADTALLVTDTGQHQIARLLRTPPGLGLLDAVDSGRGLDDVILRSGALPALPLVPLTSGPGLRAADLPALMRRAFGALRAGFQHVVVPLPPALSAHGQTLATLCDTCLLVVEQGRSHSDDVLEALRLCRLDGVNVAGLVVVRRSGWPLERLRGARVTDATDATGESPA